MLHFSDKGNAKIPADTSIFSLPAGWTCPGAKNCLAKTDRYSRKLTDGPDTEFRCYAASEEGYRNAVRDARWRNFDALITARESSHRMADMLLEALPNNPFCRIHESGDFFSQTYMDAWILVAKQRPEITFYAYTKSIKMWLTRKDILPSNLSFIASYGGKFDFLIDAHGLRYSRVVGSEEEAEMLGLPIDKDERIARNPQHSSFALLIHGTQPAGSSASHNIRLLKESGVKFSYSKRK